MSSVLYDEDLYTWSLEQASLLKKRKFDQVDGGKQKILILC